MGGEGLLIEACHVLVLFSQKRPVLTHALQFKAPLQRCRVNSMPGSIWQRQGRRAAGRDGAQQAV